ncbi:hypothetical protein QE152_g40190 [Popillia japonica]|uniref:Endonuclease/exonuclease/phosphatase domain-containing protein n=1 Tax=Popillia japonica TaxID=7064 RepID=A0AAW1HRY2_POPJA
MAMDRITNTMEQKGTIKTRKVKKENKIAYEQKIDTKNNLLSGNKMDKSQKRWQRGTWNVRGINGKEKKLEEEFERAGLEILGVTETKKKGKGCITTENGHIFMYSGVNVKSWASGGVGCITTENGHIFMYSGVNVKSWASGGVGCIANKSIAHRMQKWEDWSERNMTVEIKDANGNISTIIITYGPNEDDNKENKDKYWKELTEIMEGARGKIKLMGDFNARNEEDSIYIRNKMGETLTDDEETMIRWKEYFEELLHTTDREP